MHSQLASARPSPAKQIFLGFLLLWLALLLRLIIADAPADGPFKGSTQAVVSALIYPPATSRADQPMTGYNQPIGGHLTIIIILSRFSETGLQL